jgi:DNA repair protein RadD
MRITLRDYQASAIEATRDAYRKTRAVCLVAPTGSGKTIMGCEVVRRTLESKPDLRALWLCHRRELKAQAEASLEAIVGHSDRWEVSTVQALLRRDEAPPAGLLVYDECHHYRAEQWAGVADSYPGAWSLGLTATPQRPDGVGLGSMFGELVVAAQYSELIDAGHLVPCETMRPDRFLGSRGVAVDPVQAYLDHAQGRQAFIFAPRVEHCHELAERLAFAGVSAEVIDHTTPKAERDDRLGAFRCGRLRALVNVYTLTEGVDVPAAAVCILARGVNHASQFLQIVGRVMRPHPDKDRALLLDLSGSSHLHGLPGEDVEYSLGGRGIATAGTNDSEPGEGEAERVEVVIYNEALREVYAGAETPRAARVQEWNRLVGLCRARGWGYTWAAKEYAKLFDGYPPATMEEKAETMRQLRAFVAEKGWKSGAAAHKYRAAFGVWPRGV